MKKLVAPSAISGHISAPASKSVTQRAVAAALLNEGESTLRNISTCNDALASLDVATRLGAQVHREHKTAIIRGGFKPTENELRCGEAGLCIRMFTPIASLHDKPITLLAEGSLQSRPLTMCERPLQELGVSCETINGMPPITVKGPLRGGSVDVDGSISSQFLTGLLLAAPRAKDDTILNVHNLKSKAYVDITLRMLKQFGISVEQRKHEYFKIIGNQKYHVGEFSIEGDWSGASFLLVAGAITGSIVVENLDINSAQADKAILDALTAAGAQISILDENTVQSNKNKLRAFSFDATDCPDLFPPLVALACNCEGTTKLKGVERLRHKESDRAAALEKEFRSLGAKIRIHGDDMEITGCSLRGGDVSSHNDHRIAMAAAVAALTAEGPVGIFGAECVSKSYPEFFEDVKSLGGNVYE